MAIMQDRLIAEDPAGSECAIESVALCPDAGEDGSNLTVISSAFLMKKRRN